MICCGDKDSHKIYYFNTSGVVFERSRLLVQRSIRFILINAIDIGKSSAGWLNRRIHFNKMYISKRLLDRKKIMFDLTLVLSL